MYLEFDLCSPPVRGLCHVTRSCHWVVRSEMCHLQARALTCWCETLKDSCSLYGDQQCLWMATLVLELLQWAQPSHTFPCHQNMIYINHEQKINLVVSSHWDFRVVWLHIISWDTLTDTWKMEKLLVQCHTARKARHSSPITHNEFLKVHWKPNGLHVKQCIFML